MTTLLSSFSQIAANQLFLLIILNLIPLSVWTVWDLDQRWRSWQSRRQARHTNQRRASSRKGCFNQ